MATMSEVKVGDKGFTILEFDDYQWGETEDGVMAITVTEVGKMSEELTLDTDEEDFLIFYYGEGSFTAEGNFFLTEKDAIQAAIEDNTEEISSLLLRNFRLCARLK